MEDEWGNWLAEDGGKDNPESVPQPLPAPVDLSEADKAEGEELKLLVEDGSDSSSSSDREDSDCDSSVHPAFARHRRASRAEPRGKSRLFHINIALSAAKPLPSQNKMAAALDTEVSRITNTPLDSRQSVAQRWTEP